PQERRPKSTGVLGYDPECYVCSACTRTMSTDHAIWRCACGEGHLRLTAKLGVHRSEINNAESGLWRYAAALPLDPEPQVYLGEGCTPLVAGTWEGNPIQLNLDYLTPTGSVKDRGSAVMVSHLLQRGVRCV